MTAAAFIFVLPTPRFAWLDCNYDTYLDLAEMKSGFGIPAVPRACVRGDVTSD